MVGFIIGIVLIYAGVRLFQNLAIRKVVSADIRYRVRKLISFVGYVAVVFLLVSTFSEYLGQLAVTFGVIAAGIAFALQEVIASVAGWVAVALAGFYKPGDRVQVGGIKGDVIDIGLLRTTLMECGQWIDSDLYNGRIVRITNSYVFKEPVFNYSADFPFLWDEIVLTVKYGSDYHLAREILKRVGDDVVGAYARAAKAKWEEMVRKYRIEHTTIEPQVTVTATESWLQYTLRYIVDYRLRRSTKDQLFMQILKELDKTAGRVSIASSNIEIINMPPPPLRTSSSDSH